ncbi:MAG: hypothetical protein ACT4TC_22695 [Myxococcaceae bacterium]
MSSALAALLLSLAAAPPPNVTSPLEPVVFQGPDDLKLAPLLDLFGQYEFRTLSGAETFHELSVPRAHLGLDARWRGVQGRVLLESTRVSTGGALLGIAGDSLVIRLREAYAGYRIGFFQAQLGLVRTLEIPVLDLSFQHRPVGPSALEGYGLSSPADLGLRLRGDLPANFGFVEVAAFNGDGYTSRELNRGKNLSALVAIRPAPAVLAPLTLVVSGTSGSTGTQRSRADRLGGGALWSSDRLGFGATAWYASGIGDDSLRRGVVTELFARGELFERLILGVRASLFSRDLSNSRDRVVNIQATVGARIQTRLTVFAIFERNAPTALTSTALPGTDYTAFKLTARLWLPELGVEDLL